jgi:hypothetical protein
MANSVMQGGVIQSVSYTTAWHAIIAATFGHIVVWFSTGVRHLQNDGVERALNDVFS